MLFKFMKLVELKGHEGHSLMKSVSSIGEFVCNRSKIVQPLLKTSFARLLYL